MLQQNPEVSAHGATLNGAGQSTASCCHVRDPSESFLKLDIAIVGAGIGGLSTAIALARDGHHVTVYEAAPELSEVGWSGRFTLATTGR